MFESVMLSFDPDGNIRIAGSLESPSFNETTSDKTKDTIRISAIIP